MRTDRRRPELRLRGLLVGTLALAGVVVGATNLVAGAASTPALFVSPEVGGSDGRCGTEPDASVRDTVDALAAPWSSAVAARGETARSTASFPATPGVDDSVRLAFPSTAITAVVSTRAVPVDAVDVVTPASIGPPLVVGPGATQLADDDTLQGCAPRPASAWNPTEQPPYWNTGGPPSTDRQSVLFEFSQPVVAFGAFFGDLETRTDGQGVAARVKLFDAAGALLLDEIVPTSTVDQAGCGGVAVACGNATTRWIGFDRDGRDVASMLVIVGDDDPCASWLGGCVRFVKQLSVIAPTLALPARSDPATTTSTTSAATASTTSSPAPHDTTTTTTTTTASLPTSTVVGPGGGGPTPGGGGPQRGIRGTVEPAPRWVTAWRRVGAGGSLVDVAVRGSVEVRSGSPVAGSGSVDDALAGTGVDDAPLIVLGAGSIVIGLVLVEVGEKRRPRRPVRS